MTIISTALSMTMTKRIWVKMENATNQFIQIAFSDGTVNMYLHFNCVKGFICEYE